MLIKSSYKSDKHTWSPGFGDVSYNELQISKTASFCFQYILSANILLFVYLYICLVEHTNSFCVGVGIYRGRL